MFKFKVEFDIEFELVKILELELVLEESLIEELLVIEGFLIEELLVEGDFLSFLNG